MAGYLDQYGAGEERRGKFIKFLLIGSALALAAGGALYWTFHNYSQERAARQFFEALQKRDYQAAYRLWGCTEAKPCTGYRFADFLKDWGPNGPHGEIASYRIEKSRSCGSGVILTVGFGKGPAEKLWVERQDLTIGFSPLPGCPPGR